jgi:hypothetical protein
MMEKSSVGILKFPTEWKIIIHMFQTTNQDCSIEIVDLPMNKNGDFPISDVPKHQAAVDLP